MTGAPELMSYLRDHSRDGLRNRVESHLMTHYGSVWRVLQRNRRLERRVNAALVQLAAMKAPPRPTPLSTLAPYTSWRSLTDRSYVGRQLPPDDRPHPRRPTVERATELFRRTGPGLTCSRSTALLPAFAQWFTDGFLRGNQYQDRRRTDSPHTIDMAQLYGPDETVTHALRTHEGGRLKSRVVNGGEFPPALYENDGTTVRPEFAILGLARRELVPADRLASLFASGGDRVHGHVGPMLFNTLFLREHNRVAGIISGAHARWDDERVFQITRNIMVVMLLRLVIEEYVNHIAPAQFGFVLDPARTDHGVWHRENWATAEFSLVYRWHGLIPSVYRIGGQDMPLEDTIADGRILLERGLGPLFDDLSSQPSGRVALFNTPDALLPVESATLTVSRELRMAPYNAYREHYGMPAVTDWRQISGDPRVRSALQDLYRDVDEIDLYVGLVAEQPSPRALFGRLMQRVLIVDALTEALTNPLLAPRVYTPDTFSSEGIRILRETRRLSQIVHRNLPEGGGPYRVTFGK